MRTGFGRVVVVLVLVLAGAACELGSDPGPAPPAAAPSSPAATPTGAPSPTPTSADACPPRPDYPVPDPDRPRYVMTVDVDPEAGEVTGELSVEFTPDLATDRLVFRLWPNGPRQRSEGISLEAGDVRVRGGRARTERPDPTTLVALLDRRLAPGDTVVASLSWRLDLPGPTFDRISQNGDSIRLGSFFPLLAWEPGAGWLLDPPTASLAESSTSPTADFQVRVRVPAGLEVLASGVEAGNVWVAEAVRDFAMTVGRFEEATAVAQAPERVEVTVGVQEGMEGEVAQQYLDNTVTALEELAALYGPYPWPSLNLAITPDLEQAGIEYPTFIMQGADTLGTVTTHEVAHMWFYSLVGSNPARDPWLDEGLTTYAEGRVAGSLESYADIPIPPAVEGELGRPMTYWDQHQDGGEYFYGVYAQGAKALAALGETARVDCALALYVARNAYDIAHPEDFGDALEDVLPQADEVLARFGADV